MQGETFNLQLGRLSLHNEEGDYLKDCISCMSIEVDKTKIDLIAYHACPTHVKDVIFILRHGGFYNRFIKIFSLNAKPW